MEPISFNTGIKNVVFSRFDSAHQGQTITGEVYEGEIFHGLALFVSEFDGSETEDKETGRCLFTFSLCWRGVWESRIYFKDGEYRGSELMQLAELWQHIEDVFKMNIRAKFPGNNYPDE